MANTAWPQQIAATGLGSRSLARLQADLAENFEIDDVGRLVAHRVGPARPVPRFWFARTVVGNLWRFGAGVHGDDVADLARYASRERTIPDEFAPPLAPMERIAPIRGVLEARSPTIEEWHGVLLTTPAGGEGPVRRIPWNDRVALLASIDGGAVVFADVHWLV